jgi:hypothetical protein
MKADIAWLNYNDCLDMGDLESSYEYKQDLQLVVVDFLSYLISIFLVPSSNSKEQVI